MSVKSSKLDMILGPMFSGKTTKLHTQMTEYKYNRTGYKVLCINHSINKRYGSSNSKTHKQQSTGEHLEIDNCVSTEKLMSLLPKNLDNNVFIVDEGQFFPDLIDFVNNKQNSKKKILNRQISDDNQQTPITKFNNSKALKPSLPLKSTPVHNL